jgi:hypothetical protein
MKIVAFMSKCEKNLVQPDRSQMGNIIRRTHISSWIPKAAKIHSEYVMLSAFELPKRLGERDSILGCT